MYDLSPGITMRSTIPAYSYRHGLNFIPGIVKTRIDCYSGISNPSLIVMAPGVLSGVEPCADFIVSAAAHRSILVGGGGTICGGGGGAARQRRWAARRPKKNSEKFRSILEIF